MYAIEYLEQMLECCIEYLCTCMLVVNFNFKGRFMMLTDGFFVICTNILFWKAQTSICNWCIHASCSLVAQLVLCIWYCGVLYLFVYCATFMDWVGCDLLLLGMSPTFLTVNCLYCINVLYFECVICNICSFCPSKLLGYHPPKWFFYFLFFI